MHSYIILFYRICNMAVNSYVDLDEMTSDGEAADSFANEQKAAHAPSILIILQSLLQITQTQFKKNAKWIVPLLSALSICNDRSIRIALKLIYDEHIQPIVIEACS